MNLTKSVNNASKSLNERMGVSTYVFQLIIIIIMYVVCKMELVLYIVVGLKIFHFNHCSDTVFDFWLYSILANNDGARDWNKIYLW